MHSICPPKFCVNYRCEILLRGLQIPRGFHNNSACKIRGAGGANRLHYGQLENRKLDFAKKKTALRFHPFE